MKKIHSFLILMLALLMSSSISIEAEAAWANDSKGYYYEEGGKKVTDNWLRMTDNGGNYVYYYMGSDGYMIKGWKKINNIWYYFKDSGAMAKGWVHDGDDWYYTNPGNGQLMTGWLKLTKSGGGEVYYYLKDSGVMAKGWRPIDNAWYYFLDDGTCIISKWARINDKWYYFGADGKMVTGWRRQDSTYYYLNADGTLHTGWLQDNGIAYYMLADGKMAVNATLTIDGTNYTFGTNGACATSIIGGSNVNPQYSNVAPGGVGTGGVSNSLIGGVLQSESPTASGSANGGPSNQVVGGSTNSGPNIMGGSVSPGGIYNTTTNPSSYDAYGVLLPGLTTGPN